VETYKGIRRGGSGHAGERLEGQLRKGKNAPHREEVRKTLADFQQKQFPKQAETMRILAEKNKADGEKFLSETRRKRA